jgi:benzoyl-CoA-dihydrodiol lyase
MLVDDRSSAVSLPELPLLGVLPGTGGLTRVSDKRRVRRDLADYFSTRAEGVGGKKAVQWRLVDEAVPRLRWDESVAERAAELAARSSRPAGAEGVALTPLPKTRGDDAITYDHVEARLDRDAGQVDVSVRGPQHDPPASIAADPRTRSAQFWPLAVTRELDDLILDLRTNETELGTWVFRTKGDPALVLAYDELLLTSKDDWFANEVLHYLKRTLRRLDVTSRSLIAVIEPGSCFAGSLLELALAADRSFQLAGVFEAVDPNTGDPGAEPATITLGDLNVGPLTMSNGLTRLHSRFWGDEAGYEAAAKRKHEPLEAEDAADLGLITFAPDDIDWDDEIRIATEERASFSPDALTGLEANYRFVGPETMETKIFGRLSAWQNWIFNRPNAAGPDGALRRFGTGQRAVFDRKRV